MAGGRAPATMADRTGVVAEFPKGDPRRAGDRRRYSVHTTGDTKGRPLADAIASWDADAAHGALFDDGGALSRLIGRPTTPLADSVRQALA